MDFTLTSPAFEAGGPIPRRHTGDGADVSPALQWSAPPPGTRELALIVDDPDAPRAEPWVHWVIYAIGAAAGGLAEARPTAPTLADPAGAVQGVNSWPTMGYRGPAPPPGHGVHHYIFTLYALDSPVNAPPGLDKPSLLAAMAGHVLAQADLIGTYHR